MNSTLNLYVVKMVFIRQKVHNYLIRSQNTETAAINTIDKWRQLQMNLGDVKPLGFIVHLEGKEKESGFRLMHSGKLRRCDVAELKPYERGEVL
jgi:hypothetical protein